MFQEGDVVANKHNGSIVRLFMTTYQNPEISGLLPVSLCGHVGTSLSNEHWEKISRWLWVKGIVSIILIQLVARWRYQTDKHLGMVDPTDPSTYWKKFPPQYKTVNKTVTDYGCITYRTSVQELLLPHWRECLYHKPFEVSIFRWLWSRLKQI